MQSLVLEEVKKTKKNEPKVFPFLLMVDREAFGRIDEQAYILKSFWKSSGNKIIVARKCDTQSIVGYACYLEDNKACYLMRIGVRSKSQRQGIGRKIMDYLFEKFPKHLSLDVSTDNTKAVQFYQKCGLVITNVYLSEDKVEFNKFETPHGFVHKKLYHQQISKKFQSELIVLGEREDLKVQDDKDDLKSDQGFFKMTEQHQQQSDDETIVSESDVSDNSQTINNNNSLMI